jgi:putative holliday junction resolvase
MFLGISAGIIFFMKTSSQFPSEGRLLGVDYGSVRIGLAVCDPDRIIAFPHETYTRRSDELDAEYLRGVVQREQIVGIVLGLPISLDDTEGPKALETRRFADWLTTVTGLPLELVDERFTTSMAEDSLIAAGVKREKRKGKRDRIAAQLILQSYIDQK